jgi:hypothetical protein
MLIPIGLVETDVVTQIGVGCLLTILGFTISLRVTGSGKVQLSAHELPKRLPELPHELGIAITDDDGREAVVHHPTVEYELSSLHRGYFATAETNLEQIAESTGDR